MPLNTGQVLNNRYRIVKLLGQGGMGAVYKAWDLNMERPRALKENLDSSPEAQRQFKREAQILGDLTHPNLPKVIDHFSLPGQGQYLVMEFVEGEDLGEMLKRLGEPLTEAQVIPWIEDACAALSYLHTRTPPIIHRDIKPANLKLTPQGKVMLVDFGIAKVYESGSSTTIGARAVTPGFSPPEQYGRGGHTSPATDIYALGATLYILLTGQEPVESTLRFGHDSLPPPTQFNESITLPVVDAIQKAMQVDPQNRFQSAAEFAAALRSAPRPASAPATLAPTVAVSPALTPAPPPIPPTVVVSAPAQTKPRSRWIIPAIVGSLVILAVLGVLLYRLLNPPAVVATQEPAPIEALSVEATDSPPPPPEAGPGEAMTVDPLIADECVGELILCVGLVTDAGEIDDRSFNQSAWEGVQLAKKELGAKINYIETKEAKDYAANIALFADQKVDVIVTVGYALGPATVEAAAQFPGIKFIGVDQYHDGMINNVTGLIFNEDKAGFLVGVLAAMMSRSGTIAGVYGSDQVPPVVAFKVGYENGARYARPDINVISTFHPGDLVSAFTDPEWGAATARQALNQGADVVFGAGGKTGTGALIEVAGTPGLFCIGVDTDQWLTVPEAHPCLISSAMKLITSGVFELIRRSKLGIFPTGNFAGQVGLAPFHDFEGMIPQDVKDRLVEIGRGLNEGSIPTGYSP